MAIFRGSGGAGDATGDATNSSQLALAAAAEAQASANSAASSATNAANSASAAATDATDAAASETNAAGSASDALASENAAASSASDAADSAAAAATSATNAASSASTASTQATNASNSASSASTSATNAANSATSASTSASSASTSATTASTAATNAGNSATAAATSATNAAASASTASTQASNASTSATNAASSASAASSSASSASSSASAASTSATNAASSASAASTSASNAATSETNAASSASSAASSASSAASSASDAADSAALAATFDPALYLTKANPSFTGNLTGTGDLRLNNGNADGAQLQLASSGYSDWNWDNYSGRLRAYYGSTEYFTVTNSGNVGFGTSSPVKHLQIGNNSTTSEMIRFATTAANFDVGMTASGCEITTGNNQPIIFTNNATERMRIDSSGNLLVGTTTAFGSSGCTGVRKGSTGQLILGADSGGLYHQAVGNYYLVTTAGGATSDASLKTNVQQLSGALEKVCAIRGVNFDFIDEPMCTADQGTQLGVIAQEVEAQYPEIVLTNEDGIKTVRYDRLVAPLIEAVKELKAELDAAKVEIAALKGQA